jgi:hypothetical protein
MKTAARLLILFIVLLPGACVPGTGPAGSMFRHWIIDPYPNTGPDCCTDVLMLGDMNGDGMLDVVVGAQNAEQAGLVWYRYPSWEKHSVARGEFTTDGQTADIDQDGDTDIVVGNFTPGRETIDWFENVSGAGEGTWVRHTLGSGYVHDVETGDMDGDGDPDVVTCDKKKVVLWEQVTPLEFRRHVMVERPGEGLKLADIDGDGDPDIVFGASWLENPGALTEGWEPHAIADQWPADTRVSIADMNADGRPDVVLSGSEGEGRVSWFEAPESAGTGSWIERPIENGALEGAHSLQVADLDLDGDLDVVVAEMHTSRRKRVLIYLNQRGTFEASLLADSGSHNMQLGDIDGDGDPDIVGKNYAGTGRPIEMWENQTSKSRRWNYGSIDAARPKSQQGMMGLVFADVDRDGFTDVVAGSYLYRNPRGKLWEKWPRIELYKGVDVYFALDIDRDRFSDLVGIAGNTVFWLEAADEKASAWSARPIAKVAKEGRTQGYAAANLIPGGKIQLAFCRGVGHLYVLEIPSDPERSAWPLHLISPQAEEGGLAVGDIDGDGDLDLATVKGDGKHAIWLENPGSLAATWEARAVGETQPWMDRVAVVDINGDGKPDMVATIERQDGVLTDSLYWFEAPSKPKHEPWIRHLIARHRSVNSLDVADVDGDGAVDVVVAEHTDLLESAGAPDNLTLVYYKRSRGSRWMPEIVERGPHSSHLGARVRDLDNDGSPEVISIGWNQYRYVHLWTRTGRSDPQ